MTTTIERINKMNKQSLEWWYRVLTIQLNRPQGFGKITMNGIQYTNYHDILTLKNAVYRKLQEI